MKRYAIAALIIAATYLLGYFVYRKDFVSRIGSDGVGIWTDDKGMRLWYQAYRPLRWLETTICGTRFYDDRQVIFER